ncbi:MAG: sensor histidine kinase [Chloroflexota bacterium]
MSMRWQLILSFTLVILVAVSGMFLLSSRNATTAVRSFMYRGGMTGAGGLAAVLEEYYAQHGSWDGAEAVLSMHGGMGGQGMGGGMGGQGMGMMNQRLRLADAEGRVLIDTRADPQGVLSTSQRSSAIALAAGGRTVGYLLPEAGTGYNRADETFLVSRLTNAALTAGLIAAGLALLLAFLLTYRVMVPVRAMTAAAQRLGEGDLGQRVKTGGGDELAQLGATFNRMANSLQQAESSRRALTADIAHELRTPLAVQRANLEALQDGIYPLSVDNLAPILEQNLLLTRLVNDLRTLALADAGQLALERHATDLQALAGSTLERFRAQAGPRGIRLALQVAPGVYNRLVDPQRIEQVLGNLLSNALRHTPDGGQVTVELSTAPGGLELRVHDSGPGIPPEALEQIFERFYRIDRSRSRQEGGSGLGLAIARQIAEAHGGRLTAANHPQGGAVFTLALP